jgi:hypothetical protein
MLILTQITGIILNAISHHKFLMLGLNVSTLFQQQKLHVEISGSQGGEYKDDSFLGYRAV